MMKDSNIKIIKNILPLKECHESDKPCATLNSEQRQYIEQFNNAVSLGTVKFEAVPCLCSSKEFDLIARYDRYSMRQDTVMCTKCGLILSNPRLTEEEYARFYETDTYRKCYTSIDYLNTCRKKYNSTTGQHIFNAILKVEELNQIKTVMEFGAGGGWNLIPFKERGISAIGYDYSRTLTALGREYGLNMHKGGIAEVTGRYDVIILNHAIEHFTDLIGYIKKLKKHLNPNGIFYIAVPNIKHFNMGQLQNAHTFYFTLATLQYYMSQCDLSLAYHEPAQKIHLATIFIEGKSDLGKDLLKSNYRKMQKIIKRYYWKRYLARIINSMGIRR